MASRGPHHRGRGCLRRILGRTHPRVAAQGHPLSGGLGHAPPHIWSQTRPVDPEATGYLDELVPFEGPGTYRLEVTRGADLLAWGIAHMGPLCKSNCSGG